MVLNGSLNLSVLDGSAYVDDTIGSSLMAFQLGNEPDLFSRNGLRAVGYNFEQFAQEWQRFYDAIRARVPFAPFAGPDTAYNNEWLVPFAKQFKNQAQLISQHYYAEGPLTGSVDDVRPPTASQSKSAE